MVPDSLIDKYDEESSIVPIIGCEMMRIKHGANDTIDIHKHIINKKFKATDSNPVAPENFYDLQLLDDKFDQFSIRGCIADIHGNDKVTSLVEKLSKMSKFKVFIMASMFSDFETILRKNYKDIDVFSNDSINSSMLSNMEFASTNRKLIYLFGNQDSPTFAINDEERLEYLFSLAKTSGIKGSLLEYLSGRTLLFLGCDFSDWFMRYCIRVLYNQPYKHRPRVYIVNDEHQPLRYQELFFKNYGIELIHKFPVNGFIDEFYEKAMVRQPFKDQFDGKHVFICYSRHHDKRHAKEVNDCLRIRGVNTWYDQNDRQIGEHEPLIRGQISDAAVTRVIVCIISRALIEDVINKDKFSYVRDVEWDTAETRVKAAKHKGIVEKFGIVPFYVDEPYEYLKDVPPFIDKNFRFTEAEDKCDKLFNEIKKYLE